MERTNVDDDVLPPEETPTDFSSSLKMKICTNEKERYDEITEYIRQVDEILDFIKPFPRDHCPGPGNTLVRSTSTCSQTENSDHLENLIKLVEQLKDLKDKDSKINERTQYLKDLKRLRERKKLLKYEAELGASYWSDAKQEESDSQTKKVRSSLPFRKINRGRSKSMNIDEIAKERDIRFRRARFRSEEQRRTSGASLKPQKSKVSKWTRVKEAFRWEKASTESKANRREDVRYLQVPQDKTPESLSDSPVSGQVSGSSSVGASSTICLAVSSGYSGEHSSEGHSTSSGYGIDLPPPPPPLPSEDDFLSLPLVQDLSSSSSSEKLDELLTYSESFTKGNFRDDIIAGSFNVAFHDGRQTDDIETRRSKSLDGDAVLGPSPSLMQHLSKDSLTFAKSLKTHKTAWGKVKDIIQTRKDSLKKKPKKRNSEKCGEAFTMQSGFDQKRQEDPYCMDDKPKEILSTCPTSKIELVAELSEDAITSNSSNKQNVTDSVAKRRLTPVLTITVPSTEELRSISSAETDIVAVQKSNADEKSQTHAEKFEYFENIPKYEKNKSGSYHRFSKWSKVKRAFLTSPVRTPDFAPEAASSPSSPNKQMTFFSDIESDELSSGEWTEDKIHVQDKSGNIEAELPGVTNHEDIQKRYLEHHQKIDHEFDQRLRQWERMKAEEAKAKHERLLKKQKSEDWDKIPQSGMRQRESMAIPLPKLDDLSPEFKKKLDEWKKIKKSQTIPTVLSTPPKDETQAQNFKMRIGEWQKWRPRSSQKLTKNEPNEDFAKKLEEWQRIKGTVRRSRSQSDRGKDDIEHHQTLSPRLRRKNSKGTFKKASSSGKSSGTESLSGSLKEKDSRSGNRKHQKEKDLQWLEKELHKIERGKLRLEREKEKFLEREARLEKMKRTMGTTSPTQEILIKTPTGFFRFEGISQKFTKKLYEWEKARGIAPEASTFALLEESVKGTTTGIREESRTIGMSLQRSKSMGSVLEVSSVVQDLPHHPSSLSLNDMDELDVLDDTGVLEELRDSSEPILLGIDRDDEPVAIIVDVEDVIEETAALMLDMPLVKCETPVYICAPTEVTELISSEASDNVKIKVIEKADDQENPNMPDRNESTVTKIKSETCRNNENDFGCNVIEKNEYDMEKGNLKHSCEMNNDLMRKQLDTSTIKQQEAVCRVHELSSQLLCLAEKLEVALNERNDDKEPQNTLYNRRKQTNCLKTGEMRFVCAKGDPAENKNQSTNLMQHQDLSQLPSLITNKVLELKSGLNILKSATESPTTESSSFEIPNKTNLPVVVKEEQNERALKLDISSGLSLEDETNKDESLEAQEITIVQEPSICLERSKIQTLFGESVALEYEKHKEAIAKNNNPEVIKKKIKEKISLMQRMTAEARQRNFKPFEFNHHVFEENTDEEILEMTAEEASNRVDEKVVIVRKNGKVNRQRKLLKTRRITDTTIAYNQVAEGNKTPSEKEDNDDVFIESKTKDLVQEQGFTASSGTVGKAAVNVFVPTTRKIISPVRRDSKGTTSSVLSYVIDDISPRDERNKSIILGDTDRTPKASTSPEILRKMNLLRMISEKSNEKKDIGIPPLPNSPVPLRKSTFKETAPSIRIMIAKYNQKIEQGTSSEASASSPALWRSPVFERRLPDQDVSRNGGKFGRIEVQKSASMGLIQSNEESKGSVDSPKGILKSSSSGVVKITMEANSREEKETKPETASTLRAFRIKKAKEEFLSRGPGGQSWTSEASSPTFDMSLQDSNRLSHMSVGSESSYDETFDSNLIKSASAGTINMEDSSKRSSEPQDERTEEGLSHKAVGKTSWRSGLSSIKSRFRKVKMKKTKEHENSKMASISTLCRQSLLLEIPNGMDHLTSAAACTSKSCPSSPVLERSRSRSDDTNWLRSPSGRMSKAKPEAQ